MSIQRGFWSWFLRGSSSVAVRTTKTSNVASQTGRDDSRSANAAASSRLVSLDAAVVRFNQLAAQDDLGRQQPALTVDEVTTAIRSAGRHQLPLAESHRRVIHSIAESQQLPADARLKFTTSWHAPSGYHCEVWWIDLVLNFYGHGTDSRHASACCLRIRDHRLRSWHDPSITVPTEIQRLQEDHRWFPTGSARAELPAHH